MSKLSRFKKAPAIKLPKRLPQPQHSRFQEESDDDDDFVSRPVRSKESASAKKVSPKGPKSESQRTPPPNIEASVSEYFQPPPIKTSSQVRKKSQLTASSNPNNIGKGKDTSSSFNENKQKAGPSSNTVNKSSGEKTSKTKKIENAETTETGCSSSSNDSEKLSEEPPLQKSENDGETKGKVVCPFCWKKLGDKLTGTTHVKACAKDVPIQRVFEAMQLQEKQIEEWEKLGLEFPGFSTNANNKRAKNAETRARGGGAGGGRSRKKKAETGSADPEFELAVALSMSLHEELESRQTKENEFLIENGLEKEIGLVEVKPKDPSENTKKSSNTKRNGNIQAPSAVPASRRRGKNLPLEQLPLYTVDSNAKTAIIGERVTRILDDSEKDKDKQFYVRNQLPSNTFGVPKRLLQFQDKSSTMWACAQGGLDIPDESFSVLNLPAPKYTLERTSDYTSEGTETPNNCQSPTGNLPRETDSRLSNKIPVDKLEANLNKVDRAVERKYSNAATSSSSQFSLVRKSSIMLKNLPRVVQDIAEMLKSKEEYDLVLYAREEIAIKCNRFMIAARCPKMLKDIVEETVGKNSGKLREYLPLTNFSHRAVKAFLWYIYTGLIDPDYDDSLMAELLELAKTYSVQLDLTAAGFGQGPNKPPQCNSVEIQTDIVTTQDASVMTEHSNHCSEEAENELLGDSSTSQELFTTFDDDNNQDVDSPNSQVENKCQRKPTVKSPKEKRNEPFDDHSDFNSENEDAASGVDLFAYIEEEDELSKPTSCTVQPDPDPKKDNAKHSASAEELSEEDDFIKELLASPSLTQKTKSSEKKRSRSVSPLENDPDDLYSATQVANMLHQRQEGRNGKEYLKKANKKQKLDDSDLDIICEENESVKQSDCGYNVGKVNDFSDDVGDKWNDDSILLKMANNDVHVKDNNFRSVTPNTNFLKTRRSISTPNMSVRSPNNYDNNTSPFYNQQISGSDNDSIDNDPFGDACDDSVFANIPDHMLMKVDTPETARSKTNLHHKKIDVSRCTSQRSLTPVNHSRRKISPRALSTNEQNEESIETTLKGTKKGAVNKKTKAKAPPKIRLPTRLPSPSKEDTANHVVNSTLDNLHGEDTITPQSTRLRNAVREPSSSADGNNSKSPMLNYSTIDTPILKQELKKYGIKPLPRSKAKVLLRHIHKEINK